VSVHVLQFGDIFYATAMQNYTHRNKQWAECTGYNYIFELAEPNEEKCIYSLKVETILAALERIPPKDWIIFLDLDVQYQAKLCTAMEDRLPRYSTSATRDHHGQQCEFIALTGPHTINTGVLLVQSTNSTIQLVRRWLQAQQKYRFCSGPADQFSLQEVVMETFLVHLYDGECNRVLDMHERNLCFKKYMPEDQRSIQYMCFIGCNDLNPLQCHDCPDDSCNNEAAIFHHSRKPLLDHPPPI